jgi:hypothetical protein
MAGVGTLMQITAVDQDRNLFHVTDLMPELLVEQILQTPWLSLDYTLEEGNRELRKRINNNQLSWINGWHESIKSQWDHIAEQTGCEHLKYLDTGFWIDMAAYTCPLHTDGELPGAMQLYWVGSSPDIGTTWYQYKDPDRIRHAFEFVTNTGYIMINTPDSLGYRKLQWHGMLSPVPDNSFRVSSYSWLVAK